MKAENSTTGHNRTIRFTELPEHPKGFKDLPRELLVTIGYAKDAGESPSTIDKAVLLDGVVIPAILAAANNAEILGWRLGYIRCNQDDPVAIRFGLHATDEEIEAKFKGKPWD